MSVQQPTRARLHYCKSFSFNRGHRDVRARDDSDQILRSHQLVVGLLVVQSLGDPAAIRLFQQNMGDLMAGAADVNDWHPRPQHEIARRMNDDRSARGVSRLHRLAESRQREVPVVFARGERRRLRRSGADYDRQLSGADVRRMKPNRLRARAAGAERESYACKRNRGANGASALDADFGRNRFHKLKILLETAALYQGRPAIRSIVFR